MGVWGHLISFVLTCVVTLDMKIIKWAHFLLIPSGFHLAAIGMRGVFIKMVLKCHQKLSKKVTKRAKMCRQEPLGILVSIQDDGEK